MEIQPVQPVRVLLKTDSQRAYGFMLSLSDTELKVICHDFFEKDNIVSFKAEYFTGEGIVSHTKFSKYCFKYTLKIHTINFQPGLLINTKL